MRASILVIDDEAGIQTAFRRVFGGRYEVRTASSLQEAMESLGRSTPQVIILDLNLKREVGAAVFHEIHRAYPDLPILIMTAFSDLLTEREALAMGARGYFKKPFNLGAMRETIRTLVTQGIQQ